MGRFKLVRAMMADGWPSGHVAIDQYHTYPDRAGGGEYCVTDDTCDTEELSRKIDTLIAELQEIRVIAPKRFKQWKAKLSDVSKD